MMVGSVKDMWVSGLWNRAGHAFLEKAQANSGINEQADSGIKEHVNWGVVTAVRSMLDDLQVEEENMEFEEIR